MFILLEIIASLSAVRGMMYYRRALILQSYLEKRSLGGLLFDLSFFSCKPYLVM